MKKKLFNLIVKVVKALGINKLFHKLFQLTQKKPIELTTKDKIFGEFTDSFNNKYELHSEIRDLIKPNWRVMFQPKKELKPANKEQVRSKLAMWNKKLISVESYLNIYNCTLKDKDVLEIGAFDGATSYALAEFGAKSVVGSDIAAYYITSSTESEFTNEGIENENDKLGQLRNVFAKGISSANASTVSFKEDNICESKIEDGSMDVILSWEVLEHLFDPLKAFKEMARILRPGGIAYHEYNPFFSIIGGHSLCTLDFFWGHARIHGGDFEKYINQLRPNEKEVALSFFNNSLNRMSLEQLDKYAREAGLTPIDILPLVDRSHIQNLDQNIIKQVKNLYPTVDMADLISPFVWVIFKKD